jgi:hypothetical protein
VPDAPPRSFPLTTTATPAFAVAAAVAFSISACALAGIPPAHGLTGGERLFVVEDSSVLEILGPGLHKDDHRFRYRGHVGPVLPVGAKVEVRADYVQQRAAMAPDASLVDHNPWLYVQVIESPIPAQVGWVGWVHLGTLRREGQGAAPAVAPLGDATVARTSRLCPDGDSDDAACSINLRPEQQVRVLACGAPRARVELWSADGKYINGFINTSQLSGASCGATAKE